ncbi:hypothetical protein MSAN_00399000 [Mycena sanguinolenta]|uniref:Uncharacterized protein n=1 Tax=Mycena sanguinolenta TaxID=230812 RepID=A0A8H6ZF47_9AGAR|nr:hypothetical protein MSAN_00399000 [Mycena sanguinolenta]
MQALGYRENSWKPAYLPTSVDSRRRSSFRFRLYFGMSDENRIKAYEYVLGFSRRRSFHLLVNQMADLSIIDLPLERSWYIGNTIFAILYGIELCMCFMSAYFLWNGPKSDSNRYFYIAYSALLLVLVTIAMSCNLFFGQMMWIEHRDVEGGPVQFFQDNIAAWYNTLGTGADVGCNILGDGLMIVELYRLYVFWASTSPWIVVFPALLFLASTSMGIVATIQSGLPGNDFFHGITVVFTTPWLALTIAFNVITTTMIAFRLFSVSRSLRVALDKQRADVYTSVSAILIESATPFTLLGIAYLIVYVRGDPEALALADIWGSFVALSPQMIILRVSLGAAWSRKTVTQYGTNTAVIFTDSYMPDAYQSQSTPLQTFGKESSVGSRSGTTAAARVTTSRKSNENYEEV